jgi:uncharacterized protein (TIGR03067 family)
MPHRTLSCLACAALSLAFAPAPLAKPDSNKADLKAMQGKWTRTLQTINGTTHRQARGPVTATLKGDRMEFSATDAWKVTLDAKARPKRIDLEGAVPAVANYAFAGIYRIKGDKLTICWRLGRKGKPERPASFAPNQPGVWFQVFERVKP